NLRGPAGALRLPRPVRARGRRRAPAVRVRRVRPRLLLERRRAHRPGAAPGVRRLASPRGARLVRANPGALVPRRAPRFAAVRALAPAAAPAALLEPRGG